MSKGWGQGGCRARARSQRRLSWREHQLEVCRQDCRVQAGRAGSTIACAVPGGTLGMRHAAFLQGQHEASTAGRPGCCVQRPPANLVPVTLPTSMFCSIHDVAPSDWLHRSAGVKERARKVQDCSWAGLAALAGRRCLCSSLHNTGATVTDLPLTRPSPIFARPFGAGWTHLGGPSARQQFGWGRRQRCASPLLDFIIVDAIRTLWRNSSIVASVRLSAHVLPAAIDLCETLRCQLVDHSCSVFSRFRQPSLTS